MKQGRGEQKLQAVSLLSAIKVYFNNKLYNNIDIGSQFIELVPGNNILKATSNRSNMFVTVLFNERYLQRGDYMSNIYDYVNNIYIYGKNYGDIIGILSNQGANPQAPYYDDLFIQELDTGADTFQFSTMSTPYTQDILEIDYLKNQIEM